ncbi:hypothetical protein LCGC14_2796900, partial [marine sediment metagenome]
VSGSLNINNSLIITKNPAFITDNSAARFRMNSGGTMLLFDNNEATRITVSSSSPHVAIADDLDVAGTLGVTGTLTASDAFLLAGDLTPPQITSSQNDYNPANLASASVLRLDTDAARSIGGMVPPSPDDGRILIIHNIGANNLTLANEAPFSAAANRFALAGNITLAPDDAAILQYDTTANRWRVIGNSLGISKPLLDSAVRTDTTTSTPVRGDLIVANSSPAWDDLAIGAARRLLQVNSGGTDPEWAENIDIPGTLDVTGAATLDSTVAITDKLTVTDDVLIDGKADQVQLTLQGHSTQTNDILLVETSASSELLALDNSGNLDVAGHVAMGASGLISSGSVLVVNEQFTGSGLFKGADYTVTRTSSSGSNLSTTGLVGIARWSASGTATASAIRGLDFLVEHNSSRSL